MKDCKNCIGNKTEYCPMGDKPIKQRRTLIEKIFGGYDSSCYQTKETKQMCDMMCGTLDNDTSDDDLLAMYFGGVFK